MELLGRKLFGFNFCDPLAQRLRLEDRDHCTEEGG
jgi:hypothetical protein